MIRNYNLWEAKITEDSLEEYFSNLWGRCSSLSRFNLDHLSQVVNKDNYSIMLVFG